MFGISTKYLIEYLDHSLARATGGLVVNVADRRKDKRYCKVNSEWLLPIQCAGDICTEGFVNAGPIPLASQLSSLFPG